MYFILFIFSPNNHTANNIAKIGLVYNDTTALPTLVIVNHTKYKYILSALRADIVINVFVSPVCQKTFCVYRIRIPITNVGTTRRKNATLVAGRSIYFTKIPVDQKMIDAMITSR